MQDLVAVDASSVFRLRKVCAQNGLQEGNRHRQSKSRSPLGRQDVEVMAPSDHELTDTVEPEADETWVVLQDARNEVEQQLLDEQDDDAKTEKQSLPPELNAQTWEKFLHWCRYGTRDMSDLLDDIRNAAVRLEASNDTEKCFWWLYSAWNDAFVRSTLRKDVRLYVLFAVFFVHTIFQEARRGETLGWFAQVLADVAMVYGLTASIVTSAALGFLMGTDVKVTIRAHFMHLRMMSVYRKLVASGTLEGRVDQKPPCCRMIEFWAVLVSLSILAIALYVLYFFYFFPAGTPF
ncbi:hypothetical protein MRX96_056696 [Rhipicephalus microplus]